MTKFMDTSEVLEAMRQTDHPRYEQHRARLEGALTLAGADLAAHVGIISDLAKTEFRFGGLMVALRPVCKGQKWPDELSNFDPDGEFE